MVVLVVGVAVRWLLGRYEGHGRAIGWTSGVLLVVYGLVMAADRAPWLAVLFAGGILAWFALSSPWQWTAAIGVALFVALFALALWRDRPDRDQLRRVVMVCGLVFAAGMAVIWAVAVAWR